MNIEIVDREGDVTPALRSWAERTTQNKLRRFSRRIERVVVRFDDVNSSRGGEDKRISIDITGTKGFRARLSESADSYRSGLMNLLSRAKHSIVDSPEMGSRSPRRDSSRHKQIPPVSAETLEEGDLENGPDDISEAFEGEEAHNGSK